MDFYDVINIYGPLVAWLIAAIVVTVVFYKRIKKRRELSKHNPTKSKLSSSKAYHKHEMPGLISKSQPEQKEPPTRDRLEQKPTSITTCPKCKMKVLPKSDGTCPSCQAKISS